MKKALLIIDMSVDFVDENGSLTLHPLGEDAKLKILALAQQYHSNDDLVVFCMDYHQEDDPHFELWPKHNVANTEGAKLTAILSDFYETNKNAENVYFVKKTEYDAFHETNLNEILQANNVDEVTIVGVCTDICVYQTCYGAYKNKYKINVVREGCATFTNFEEQTFEQMKQFFKVNIID